MMRIVCHYCTVAAAAVLLLLLCAATPTHAQLRRKRQATTVAGIDAYFQKMDSDNGMVRASHPFDPNGAQVSDPYPWHQTKQFSMPTTEPPEPIEPPDDDQNPTSPPVDMTEECRNADRETVLKEELSDLTDASVLTNFLTPQGMAYQWILNDDNIDACLEPDRARQRYALAVLYYSTSGDGWTDRMGWLSELNECRWARVTCHENGSNRVSALRLGALPADCC